MCKRGMSVNYVCVRESVWRAVWETREGWQLNSELTHDSTTSTHSVLYTAALTEPNSHFSFSFWASLHHSHPPLSIHPSIFTYILSFLFLILLILSVFTFYPPTSPCLFKHFSCQRRFLRKLFPTFRLLHNLCTFLRAHYRKIKWLLEVISFRSYQKKDLHTDLNEEIKH